ncbi:putative AT-rich interactive domain-containing protein 4 [Nannochloris sp. 'desiccata']|nr:hypothetical protein KSW81_003702 [Chlorella desiccata (nom. nud.)]KAH7615951.1 putative AT-rich interactive domain-containing protein 4 [Chlorella desiccata (nom. nud.)]
MARTPGKPMKILGLLSGPTVESFIEGEQRGLGCIEEVFDLPENVAQVQVTKYPKLEDLPAQLKSMQPDIVYVNAGAATPSSTATDTKDNKSSPSLTVIECLSPLPFTQPTGTIPEGAFTDIFSGFKIKLMYLDAANTLTLGQKLFALEGVEHVICWAPEAPPIAFHSMYFAHIFFACLENPALILPEAYAIASHLTRTFCGRVDGNSGKVTEPNLPRLISAVPGILPTSASIPPYIHREENAISNIHVGTGSSAAVGGVLVGGGAAGSAAAGPSNDINDSSVTPKIGIALDASYSQLRLCVPHAEIRMMLAGLYDVINAHCMAHLCESFRALLVAEVRSLKLIKTNPCTAPPAYLPPGSNAVKCEIRTATGIPFTVMLGGPPEALRSHGMVQYALRQTVTADAQALQLKLPPPGAPLPSVKSNSAVAGGAYCIEIMALTSTWVVQVIKEMCRNARSRTLVSLGVAAVSNHPTSAFSKSDGKRFMAIASGNDSKKIENLLNSEEPPVMPGSIQKKARVAPPMPVTAAEAAAATAAVFAAAAAARVGGGNGQPRSRPGSAAAVVGGAKTPALEGVAPRPPSVALGPQHGGFSALAPVQFPAGAVGAPRPAIPRIIASPFPNNNNPPMNIRRPAIDVCTEAVFISDLVTFLKTQLGRSVNPVTFPEISLNGSKLDVFTLYREVCRRGGYNAANRIDWKNGVFPWMKNFSSGHRLTNTIGNMLKHHYQSLLLEYERKHPGDVQKDGCVSCGDGGAGGDGSCAVCRQGGSGRSSAAGVTAGDALMGPGGATIVALDTS